MSVYLSIHLVCPSICPSILSVCLSLHPSCLSICPYILSVRLSAHPSCLSVYLPIHIVCLSICPSILSVCLSVHPYCLSVYLSMTYRYTFLFQTTNVEEYFDIHASDVGPTSDSTLAKLDMPHLDHKSLTDILESVQSSHRAECKLMYQELREMFKTWMFQMW